MGLASKQGAEVQSQHPAAHSEPEHSKRAVRIYHSYVRFCFVVHFKMGGSQRISRNSPYLAIRQWPEVYDSCHTFLHVAREKRAIITCPCVF